MNRLTIDPRILERPLREIYLRPFKVAVWGTNLRAVMTSYDLVDRTHTGMHGNVLKEVLHGGCGYDGFASFTGEPYIISRKI